MKQSNKTLYQLNRTIRIFQLIRKRKFRLMSIIKEVLLFAEFAFQEEQLLKTR